MYPLPEPLALREVRAEDQEFLAALYFASREDLHQAVPDAAMLRQLISMQQAMQQAGFRQNFPAAAHLIVLRHGQPIGQVVVDTGSVDIRLVDIAITPAERRTGAGSAVVRALQAAARAQGLAVSLSVSQGNPAARALYQGLGFTVSSDDPVFAQMVWRVPSA